MYIKTHFLKFAALAFCFGSIFSQPLLAEDASPRIVGGTNYTESYPWMAALTLNNNPQNPECGSTLIDEEWILTAAHCVTYTDSTTPLNASRLAVTIGETDLTVGSPSEEYREISQVIVHPNYNARSFNNDIALLKLSEPSTLTPIKIASSSLPSVTTGSALRALGWGATSANPDDLQLADVLKEVSLPLVNQNTCYATYANSTAPIISSKFCAGLSQGGVDSCAGDSGGPLVFKQNNQWYQVGIVSYGESCAAANSYGVNTRVSSFNNWINCSIYTNCGNPVTPVEPTPITTPSIFEILVGIFALILSLLFQA